MCWEFASAQDGMVRGEPMESVPLYLCNEAAFLGCADAGSAQAGWGIEQREAAECLTNSITKGICLNASPSVPPRSLSLCLASFP